MIRSVAGEVRCSALRRSSRFTDAVASGFRRAADPAGPRRHCLSSAAPRQIRLSTSSILGTYLLERLAKGWETESLTLRASLSREGGEPELVSAVDRAGLIRFGLSTLYRCLAYLATKALALIAAHRRATAGAPLPQRLVAIVNSGFPETHQNAVALAICQEFAAQGGITWSGGLALGGGGVVGLQPLTVTKRSGPPIRHVIQALDLDCRGSGRRVPGASRGGKPDGEKSYSSDALPSLAFDLCSIREAKDLNN